MGTDCNELLSRLEDLVDGELSSSEEESFRAHLSRCPSCNEAHSSLARLKRLVEEKVRRPQAPSNLREAISKGLEKELEIEPAKTLEEEARESARATKGKPVRQGRRFRVLALAAALVISCSLAAFLFFKVNSPKLGHAEAASACAEAFRSLLAGGPETKDNPEEWKERLIGEIEGKTGIRLDHVPEIPHAAFLRWEPQTVKGLKGVRMDFQPEIDRPGETQPGEQPGVVLISVFFLPLTRMDFRCGYLKELESGHPCTRCIQLKDGSIYCLRTDNFFLGVVSNLGEGELLARHCPTCR